MDLSDQLPSNLPEPEPDAYSDFINSPEILALIGQVTELRAEYFGKDESKFRKLDSFLTILNLLK